MKITPELQSEDFRGKFSEDGEVRRKDTGSVSLSFADRRRRAREELVGEAGFPPLKGTCIGQAARTL